MLEALHDAQSELRRVDHQIFVSLKYTRTVDVLKNTIQRMINYYEKIVEAILKKAIEDDKLQEMEATPIKKTEQVTTLYSSDEVIHEHIEKYLELRKIIRAKFTKREEYRRHLTMTVFLENGVKKDITTDSLRESYDGQQEFLEYVKVILLGKTEEY